MTQEHITREYAAVLTDKERLPQLRAYIEQFVRDGDFQIEGMSADELTERLYREMAEYSVLTPYLGAEELEEINVNSWDDIALTRTDGSIVKAAEHFHSPQHAEDIVKRLLQHHSLCGTVCSAGRRLVRPHGVEHAGGFHSDSLYVLRCGHTDSESHELCR